MPKESTSVSIKCERYLISADDLARMLGVSRRSIWRLNSAGRIPRQIKIGGSVRWDCDEINRWILAGCQDRRAWEDQR